MTSIRILIADDHKLLREAWASILNSDPRFQVIATCGDAEEAIEITRVERPEIVLMDINMTPISGIEATKKIRHCSPTSRVIGLSMHSNPIYTKRMIAAGARGYLTKNSSKDEMMHAIVTVHGGEKYICEEIKDKLAVQVMEETSAQPDINTLTEREMQIVGDIRTGLSSKEIAIHLFISLKTVEVHRHNILKKLGMRNAALLVNFVNRAMPFSS